MSCSAASRFLAPFMTKNTIAPPAPASDRAAGPRPFGCGMRYESSATGFLSTTALANTVPALLVMPILPPSQASLLLGSVQPATPAGSIDANLGSVYVSLSQLRPSSALVRYGSLLRTTIWPVSSVSWPPNIQMALRSMVSPSPERFEVMPQPQNSLSGLEILSAASRSLPRPPSS